MTKWQKIILHHSLTKDGTTVDWDSIRRYHMSYRIDGNIVSREVFLQRKEANQGSLFELPDLDIGYHLGIELVANVVSLQIGRPFNMDGAHTKGQNQIAIGVCVIGNFDLGPPLPEIIDKVVEVCIGLCLIFSIPPSEIFPHSKFAPKSCPGKYFPLDDIKTRVANKFVVSEPELVQPTIPNIEEQSWIKKLGSLLLKFSKS